LEQSKQGSLHYGHGVIMAVAFEIWIWYNDQKTQISGVGGNWASN